MSIYGWPAMIFLGGLKAAPIFFLLIRGLVRAMDPTLEEASRISGAGISGTVRRVVLPLVGPGLFSIFLLVFLSRLDSLEMPLLIGVQAGINTISVVIFNSISGRGSVNYGLASAFGVLLTLLVVLLIAVYSRYVANAEKFVTVSGKASKPSITKLGRWRHVAVFPAFLYLALVLFLPISIMFLYSFTPRFAPLSAESMLIDLSLDNYLDVFNRRAFLRATSNSVMLAVVTAILTIALTFVAAWITKRSRVRGKGMLEQLTTLPVVVPSIVFGLAILWTYIQTPLYQTLWILLIAYTAHSLPYGMRTISPAIVQIHRDLEDQARICGASRGSTIKTILLPLLRRSLLSSGALIILRTMKEFPMSLLLWGVGTEVITVVIYDYWLDSIWPVMSAAAIITLFLQLPLVLMVMKLGDGPQRE